MPETHKVIAVDVEITGYYPGIDLDDFDILSGDAQINLGSDPQILGFADSFTRVVKRESNLLPPDLGPIRRLLLYAVPRDWTSIQLGYWDILLTAQPVPLSDTGPGLAAETSVEPR